MRRKYVFSMAITGMILGVWCLTARPAVATSPPATLRAITTPAPPGRPGVFLRIDGDYSYKTVQATDDTVFVDLMGVQAGAVTQQGVWTEGLVTGYELLRFTEGTERVLRVQLDLKHHEPFRVLKSSSGLSVLFGEGQASAVSSPASGAARPGALVSSSHPPANAPVTDRSSAKLMTVQGVSIKDNEQGVAYVVISITGAASYRVLRLENPPRLVVDFDNAVEAHRPSRYPAHSPFLSDVRVAQFRVQNPAIVRVVADLTGNPASSVSTEPGGVRIALRAPSAGHATAQAPETPPPTTPAAISKTLGAAQPTSQKSTPAAALTVPASSQDTQHAAASPKFDSALPVAANLTAQAAPRPAAVSPAQQTAEASAAAKVMQGSTQEAPESAQGQPPAPAAADQQQPKYTGETISLNLKDVDLKDFFRLIHEISGLNIIVDSNVAGSVTMVLDNVPWDQALDIVLKDNQLGKVLEGNVLRIARVDTLTTEQQATAKLAEASVEAQPLVTRFVPVNYAKAAAIATTLKSWVGGGALTKRGNVLVDDRTNTLIISDVATQILIIEKIVSQLDTKTKQVAIEARVELVTKKFERDLANALAGGYVNRSGRTPMVGSTGSGSSSSTTIPDFTKPIPFSVKTTPATAAGFGTYALMNVGARYFIDEALSVAETNNLAKVISKPSIVTQNNIPGTVIQGVQIPVQTTINNTISVIFVQASLQLTVTPQVTADGNVFLVINVSNNSVGVLLPLAPAPQINTQSATTQVLVPDGGTVVFGGVSIKSTSNNQSYVPVLGKIPVFGNLFKSTIKTEDDSELVFFVTPKVLPG